MQSQPAAERILGDGVRQGGQWWGRLDAVAASLAHDAGGYILPWQVHCWTCVQCIKRRIRAQWVLRRGPARVPAS